MRKGLFLTLEGGEACGKSTQVKMLANYYSPIYETLVLREPGGTPPGEEIRHLLKYSANGKSLTPKAEVLLMNASRTLLVDQVIRPALDEGKFVICDRFYDSTLAYQGYGRMQDLIGIQNIVDYAIGDATPDLTLLYRVPEKVRQARLKQRTKEISTKQNPLQDRFEAEDKEFFRRVDRGYEALAIAHPDRIKVIDGSSSSIEVFQTTKRYIDEALKCRDLLKK